jgi:hypothetical protein
MTPRTLIAFAALTLVTVAGCGDRDGAAPASSSPPPTGGMPAAGAEQAVIVHLAIGPAGLDFPVLQALEDRLSAAIETSQVGEYDGNAVGPDEAILYAYGPDADELFEVMQPILESSAPADGSYAVKRYGGADDPGAGEVRVELGSAG